MDRHPMPREKKKPRAIAEGDMVTFKSDPYNTPKMRVIKQPSMKLVSTTSKDKNLRSLMVTCGWFDKQDCYRQADFKSDHLLLWES